MEGHSKNLFSHYFILSIVVICFAALIQYTSFNVYLCLLKTKTYVSSKHFFEQVRTTLIFN